MKFYLIHVNDPSLLLNCKPINDLVTCPSISLMISTVYHQHLSAPLPPQQNYPGFHEQQPYINNQPIPIEADQYVEVYEECTVILQLPEAIKNKQSKYKTCQTNSL